MPLMPEVFLGGQLLIEAWGLEDDADLPAKLIAIRGKIESEHGDFAGLDGNERAENSKESGFAAAVGAEESEDFAAADFEGKIVQCQARRLDAVVVAQVIDSNDGWCWFRSRQLERELHVAGARIRHGNALLLLG